RGRRPRWSDSAAAVFSVAAVIGSSNQRLRAPASAWSSSAGRQSRPGGSRWIEPNSTSVPRSPCTTQIGGLAAACGASARASAAASATRQGRAPPRFIAGRSSLAPRTAEGRAPRLHDPAHQALAAGCLAAFALAVVDGEAVLEVAELSVGGGVV